MYTADPMLEQTWPAPSLVMPGLGALSPAAANIIMSAPQIGGAVVGTAASMGAAWATAAIPFVGPAVAGVTVALALLMSRKRPQQKIATTDIVNEAEPVMRENLSGYLNGPRSPASQVQALENFDALWQWVVTGCSDPEMGEPGRNCISERRRGGSAPWCPTGRGCDWFTLYRDPIANDTPIETPAPGGSNSPAPGGTWLSDGTWAPGGTWAPPSTDLGGIPRELLLVGGLAMAALLL